MGNTLTRAHLDWASQFCNIPDLADEDLDSLDPEAARQAEILGEFRSLQDQHGGQQRDYDEDDVGLERDGPGAMPELGPEPEERTISPERQAANAAQRQYRRDQGMTDRDVEVGHTRGVRYAEEAGAPPEVVNDPDTFMQLHDRPGQGLDVQVTDQDGETRTTTRHRAQEDLMDESMARSRVDGELGTEGLQAGGDELLWRTQGTGFDQREVEIKRQSGLVDEETRLQRFRAAKAAKANQTPPDDQAAGDDASTNMEGEGNGGSETAPQQNANAGSGAATEPAPADITVDPGADPGPLPARFQGPSKPVQLFDTELHTIEPGSPNLTANPTPGDPIPYELGDGPPPGQVQVRPGDGSPVADPLAQTQEIPAVEPPTNTGQSPATSTGGDGTTGAGAGDTAGAEVAEAGLGGAAEAGVAGGLMAGGMTLYDDIGKVRSGQMSAGDAAKDVGTKTAEVGALTVGGKVLANAAGAGDAAAGAAGDAAGAGLGAAGAGGVIGGVVAGGMALIDDVGKVEDGSMTGGHAAVDVTAKTAVGVGAGMAGAAAGAEIGAAVGSIIPGAGTVIGLAAGALVGGAVGYLGNELMNTETGKAVLNAAGDAVDATIDGVKEAGEAVGDAASAAGGAISDAAGAVADAASSAASAAEDAVGDAASAVGDAAGSAVDAIKDLF